MAMIARDTFAGMSCADSFAFEDAARGEDLAVGRLDDERARRRFDHQSSADGQGGHAVGDVSGGNDDDRSQRGGNDMRAPRLERESREPLAAEQTWSLLPGMRAQPKEGAHRAHP